MYSEIILTQFNNLNSDNPNINSDISCISALLENKNNSVLVSLNSDSDTISLSLANQVKWVISCNENSNHITDLIEEAKRLKVTNLLTKHCSFEKIPFSDSSVDIVVSRLCLNKCFNIHSYLKEVYRILKPGGNLIISDIIVPDVPVFDTWLNTFRLVLDNSHIRSFSIKQITNLLENYSFSLEDISSNQLTTNLVELGKNKPSLDQLFTIKNLLLNSPKDVNEYFNINSDLSLQIDTAVILATK